MKISTFFFKSVLVSVFCCIGLMAGAQKLPNTQQQSLRLPANFKIDGKAIEWNNQFRAYNKSTDVYYTIANDDEHLYLIMQATDPKMISKMIGGGGVTLTIQKSGKKSDKGGISIMYPVFDKKTRPAFNLIAIQDKEDAHPGSVNKDSVMSAYNKTLGDRSKLISITGIAGMDSLISVYNEDGIKVAGMFDNKLAYTYELSVDLKQLGLTINDAAKFAYHTNIGSSISKSLASMMSFEVGADGAVSHGGANPAAAYTDFWGEYTLAKK